ALNGGPLILIKCPIFGRASIMVTVPTKPDHVALQESIVAFRDRACAPICRNGAGNRHAAATSYRHAASATRSVVAEAGATRGARCPDRALSRRPARQHAGGRDLSAGSGDGRPLGEGSQGSQGRPAEGRGRQTVLG